ncbi:MAG: hypothetical protein KAS12_04270, partial [Candidatus Aenigmarchaeota archaeon]|nr:hypothetical protein [Candidatus Aenigmarchaeota archaeon]
RNRKLLFKPANKIVLLQTQGIIMKSIKSGNKNFNMFGGATACAQAIKLSHLIELLETQTLHTAVEYMKNLFEQASQNKSKAAKQIAKNPDFNQAYVKTNELLAKNLEHPKLLELKSIIEDSIKNNPLFVELNGYKIYEDKPLSSTKAYEQKFTQLATKLKTGENVLTVSAGKDSKYSLKSPELTIFFYSSGKAVSKTKTFDIDRYIIYLMESSTNVTGRINLTVNEIPVDTGLTVKLNEKKYTIDAVGSNETVLLPFVLKDIHEGKNTLSFSTYGTYKLGEAKVEVIDVRED